MENTMPPQAPPTPAHRIVFTGDGGTYFGIWIVNTVLTVLTLGIYSPWAKARRLRYFYGNTLLDGSPFEFHGSPIAMLKGRIIAVVLFLAYSQTAKYSISAWIAVVSLIAAFFPWLLWKSLRFRMNNSSYRGIRFAFTGTVGGAYAVFVPFIAFFVLPFAFLYQMKDGMKAGQPPSPGMFVPFLLCYLLFLVVSPWLYQRVKRYQHENLRLGGLPFAFSGSVGRCYVMALKILGLFILAMFADGILVAVVMGMTHGHGQESLFVVMPFALVASYLVVLCIFPLVIAMTQNFVWGNTSLGGIPVASHASGLTLLGIDAVNALGLLFSLGLFWPFALIRHLRYRVSCLDWSGDPALIQAGSAAPPGAAVGEETAEMFGFDLAL